MSRPSIPANQRFDGKYIPEPMTGCHLWTGRTMRGRGYGVFDPIRRPVLAHRWAYEQLFGPIPTGMNLHHVCHTPSCVNPLHLRAMKQADHNLVGDTIIAKNKNKTHCPRGHEYTPENTYINSTLHRRRCRVCTLDSNRRSVEKRSVSTITSHLIGGVL